MAVNLADRMQQANGSPPKPKPAPQPMMPASQQQMMVAPSMQMTSPGQAAMQQMMAEIAEYQGILNAQVQAMQQCVGLMATGESVLQIGHQQLKDGARMFEYEEIIELEYDG